MSKNKKIYYSSILLLILSLILCLAYFKIFTFDRVFSKYNRDNTMYLVTENGVVTIRLLPEFAPKTVTRIKDLVKDGYYDNTTFHRALQGYLVQAGDISGDGSGKTGKNLPLEYSSTKPLRGMVGMARRMDINSNDSQFFILLRDSSELVGQYTFWGKVIDGMELLDKVKWGDVEDDGFIKGGTKIIAVRMHENYMASEFTEAIEGAEEEKKINSR